MFRRNNLIVHSSLGQLSPQWPNFFHLPLLFSSVAHQCLPVDPCKIHLSWYSPFHRTGKTHGLCLSLETVTQSTSPEILKVLKCMYLVYMRRLSLISRHTAGEKSPKINKRTGEFLKQTAVPNKIYRIQIKSLKRINVQSNLFGTPEYPIWSLFHYLLNSREPKNVFDGSYYL